MLKAYIDDSNMRQPPFYVLGGWFAPVHVWTKFSDAWRDVLWMKPRIDYFKYAEAMNFKGQFGGISEEKRNEKLRLLVNLIEEYQVQGVCSVIPHNVFAPPFGDLPHKTMRNPYFISFFGIVALMAGYLSVMQKMRRLNSFLITNLAPTQCEKCRTDGMILEALHLRNSSNMSKPTRHHSLMIKML